MDDDKYLEAICSVTQEDMDKEAKLAESLIEEFENPKNALLGALAFLKKQHQAQATPAQVASPVAPPAPAPVREEPVFKPRAEFQPRTEFQPRADF
jgi:hypothetical protein